MTDLTTTEGKPEGTTGAAAPGRGGPGAPGRLDRAASGLVAQALARIRGGRIELSLPDGRGLAFGQPGATTSRTGVPLTARITVHDWSFFRRVAIEGGTGAGGAYIDGLWTCDDLVALIRIVAASELRFEHAIPLSRLGTFLGRMAHRARRNTRRGARRNIVSHYDLGNEFYALWLDDTMTYSCAVFGAPGQSLEAAQRNKYRMIAEKARLGSGDRVLEIGCGWGGFAIFAAREYGCRVTGISLSEAQTAFARRRVVEERLGDRVSIEIIDYRDVEGEFDRIVSIEMAEAVGHRFLNAYCAAFDRLLAADGIAVVQVITVPDARYAAYRKGVDYTQRYIFPGSHLPSLGALMAALSRTRLGVEDLTNIGVHYAETLRRWRSRFLERADAVRALGFDSAFIRRWEYYLAYCEAGFLTRQLNDLQLVLTRAGNPTLPAGPHRAESV